jgi:hypothetical protein
MPRECSFDEIQEFLQTGGRCEIGSNVGTRAVAFRIRVPVAQLGQEWSSGVFGALHVSLAIEVHAGDCVVVFIHVNVADEDVW